MRATFCASEFIATALGRVSSVEMSKTYACRAGWLSDIVSELMTANTYTCHTCTVPVITSTAIAIDWSAPNRVATTMIVRRE